MLRSPRILLKIEDEGFYNWRKDFYANFEWLKTEDAQIWA